MTHIDADQVQRLTITVEQAGKILGISRATAYALARQGRLGAIRISDKRFVVPMAKLAALLEGEPSRKGVSHELDHHGTDL